MIQIINHYLNVQVLKFVSSFHLIVAIVQSTVLSVLMSVKYKNKQIIICKVFFYHSIKYYNFLIQISNFQKRSQQHANELTSSKLNDASNLQDLSKQNDILTHLQNQRHRQIKKYCFIIFHK